MNPTRYSRAFYSTPHYTPTQLAAPIFAVKSLHVVPRHSHCRGHALVKRRHISALTTRAADSSLPAKS